MRATHRLEIPSCSRRAALIPVLALVLLAASCGSSSGGGIGGQYILTPTTGGGGPYHVDLEYVFHSAEVNLGAGPGCVDVVYDQVPSSGASIQGFDFYRDQPGQTCPNHFFNSDFLFVVGSQTWLHTLNGDWSAASPGLKVTGSYTRADPASGQIVGGGTFTFQMAINPLSP